MKKGLVFVLGMIVGALLTIIVYYRIGHNSSDGRSRRSRAQMGPSTTQQKYHSP